MDLFTFLAVGTCCRPSERPSMTSGNFLRSMPSEKCGWIQRLFSGERMKQGKTELADVSLRLDSGLLMWAGFFAWKGPTGAFEKNLTYSAYIKVFQVVHSVSR